MTPPLPTAVRDRGWHALSLLHTRIADRLERSLQRRHRLSVSEYSVLAVLSAQPARHMRMQALSHAVALSQSATTRLVSRLEQRGLLARYLCQEDRRGIYTRITGSGEAALAAARPTHEEQLRQALAEAAEQPELAPLVEAMTGTGD
ncbi:DNA-binding MarR family transcriptional regulator [Stackebrandtia albiflava]|uniref:DNA-binding MarR family transcriptional regulator n=1 Tax=Stackebrandtia albiflava TaxID=406432 RepID=A0A562V504_9ACTN|nr:MarR family transcriptional regulator [Stackebrandtia albiflava]TWJ12953.1 DNA-binding MarR family transcriptional regulator [Stackebrandtia albiflava]